MRPLTIVCLTAVLALAWGPAGAQMARARAPAAAEPSSPVARWPDAVLCHFPERPALDAASGQASGKMLKAYTQVSRLVLAPASDGRYYYSDGPVSDGGAPNAHWPEAVLIFKSDGTPAVQVRSDCTGRTISQLIAAGQAH